MKTEYPLTNAVQIVGNDPSGNPKKVTVDANGNIGTTSAVQVAASSTVTSVAASVTNVTLLVANSNRKGAVFYNDSTSACYLKLGTTASNISFTQLMQANSTFIIDSQPIYTGRVDAIWVSANGAMRVTELV